MRHLGLLALWLGLISMTTPAVGAQVHPPAQAAAAGRLELVAQTVWIGATPAVIDLRVTSSIEDRRLEIRIHGPITDPGSLRASFTDPPVTEIISRFSVSELDDLTVGVGDVVSITLPDEEIGEVLRRQPGALPVIVDLTENGIVVDTVVTALLVADPAATTVDIKLAFIADLRTPLAHAVDQSISVDPLILAEDMTAFAEGLHPSATVSLTPETLSALDTLDTAPAASAISTISSTLEPHSLFATPWVDLDEEAWRQANEDQLVLDSYRLAQSVLEDHLGRSASAIARLDPDATPATLGLLRTAGVSGVLVEAERISPIDIRRANGRPLQLVDDNGVAMPVVPVATSIHDALTGNDVELAAHQLLSELVLLSTTATTPRGFVIDLDTVNLPALDALLTKISSEAAINTAGLQDVLALQPARSIAGTIILTELASTETTAIGGEAIDLRLTEAVVDSYESMVSPAEAPIAPLRTLLLVASASELDAEASRAYTDEVFAAVSEGIGGFEVLEGSRITLASRTAELPITLQNGQSLPIRVTLTITSEKLRFPDGETLALRLEPGANEIAIQVETVSSGDARLTATLTSPDGRLDLATGNIDIRSTAISGLGLVISVVALLVLGAWWARTILRVRRNRHAASVAAADSDSP